MEQWEYKIVTLTVDNFGRLRDEKWSDLNTDMPTQLNKHGAAGWELVQVAVLHANNGTPYMCFFKRRKP